MFLHCLALNKAEIAVPWNNYAAASNSLFAFRLVLGLVSTVPLLPILAIMVVTFIRLMNQTPSLRQILLGLLPLRIDVRFRGRLFLRDPKLTTDFVVPIMFLRGSKCVSRVVGIPQPALPQHRQVYRLHAVPDRVGHHYLHACPRGFHRQLLYRLLPG